ncbi:hypothetical protein ACFYWS_13230 [Streptomyces sp. NPDC002795]|uniref:hypothetical protein n=1 Tax=Streptomyces sp. NPDC002795 TaxID=3364665 RepID=UPI0036B9FD41
MKKILSAAGLALAITGLAAPAHAANGGSLGSGIGVADDWDATAAATCLQEVAVAPMLGGGHVGEHTEHCQDGSLITHGK